MLSNRILRHIHIHSYLNEHVHMIQNFRLLCILIASFVKYIFIYLKVNKTPYPCIHTHIKAKHLKIFSSVAFICKLSSVTQNFSIILCFSYSSFSSNFRKISRKIFKYFHPFMHLCKQLQRIFTGN